MYLCLIREMSFTGMAKHIILPVQFYSEGFTMYSTKGLLDSEGKLIKEQVSDPEKIKQLLNSGLPVFNKWSDANANPCESVIRIPYVTYTLACDLSELDAEQIEGLKTVVSSQRKKDMLRITQNGATKQTARKGIWLVRLNTENRHFSWIEHVLPDAIKSIKQQIQDLSGCSDDEAMSHLKKATTDAVTDAIRPLAQNYAKAVMAACAERTSQPKAIDLSSLFN